jgi:hypothetical protein
MDGATFDLMREVLMAEEEPILVNPPTQEMAHHVADYESFTKLFKWGAIVCLIIGLLSLIVIKSYW